MPIGSSKQLRIHRNGIMQPCPRRRHEGSRRGGVCCCCGRGVDEKDECETWGFDRYAAGVSSFVTGDGGYIELAFRPAVDFEFVSESLEFRQWISFRGRVLTEEGYRT
jgi:hypothetical protein